MEGTVWSTFMRFIFSLNSYKAKAGVGIVVAYTAYASYVQVRTNYEISERERKKAHESDLER